MMDGSERKIEIAGTREHDMRGGVRGKYVKRFPKDVVMVTLAPDVAAVFPEADSVNEALRVLIKAAKKVAPHALCQGEFASFSLRWPPAR